MNILQYASAFLRGSRPAPSFSSTPAAFEYEPSLSPLAIPEILEHVLSFLDREDIIHSARAVSRQWYHTSQAFYTHPLIIEDRNLFFTSTYDELVQHVPYAGSLYWTSSRYPEQNQQAWSAFANVLQQHSTHSSSSTSSHSRMLAPPPQSSLLCLSSLSRSTALVKASPQRPLIEFYYSGNALSKQLDLALPFLSTLTRFRFDCQSAALTIQDILDHCPMLTDLHVQGAHLVGFPTRTLSSPPDTPAQRNSIMPLRSLRIKNSRVSLRWLSLTLERCPRLETLELMTNKISNNFFWTTNMSTINFISFALGQRISSSTASHTSNSPSTILPSLRRVHFSRKGATLEELTNDTAQSLLESIRTSVIPEWSFCYYDALSKANWLELALVPETNDIDNTIITHLEFYIPPPDKEGKLKLFKDNWAEKGEGFDLNRVLGRLPALQVLKAQGIICNLGDLNPFPIDVESGLWQESQEQLQQQQQQRTFNEEDEEGDGNRNEDHSQPEHGNDNKKVDMDDAVGHSFHGDGNNSDIIETERDLRKPVFSEPRRLWACRDLHTLEIHFYKSSQKKQQKKLEERDMRIMFGYLSKMCPKLRNLHIELDDTTPLNLTSGMCLLSRLQFLKKAVIQVYKKPGGYFWGGRGWADLSWMKRQGPTISNVDKMISYLGGQEWWERKMLVEQVLIQGRKAFVKEFGLGNEHEGMCKLGTLMDVWDCLRDLDTIASSDESWEPPAVLVPGLRS